VSFFRFQTVIKLLYTYKYASRLVSWSETGYRSSEVRREKNSLAGNTEQKPNQKKKKKGANFHTISAPSSSAFSLLYPSEPRYDQPSRRRRRSPRAMYKLGGRGGGRGGSGAAKRPPPPHGRGRGGASSIGGMSGAPRGRAAAATQPAGRDEAFSLESSGPPAFAAIIRLTPDLVDEIRRAEEAGGGARIKFNPNMYNSSENVSFSLTLWLSALSVPFESLLSFNLTNLDTF